MFDDAYRYENEGAADELNKKYSKGYTDPNAEGGSGKNPYQKCKGAMGGGGAGGACIAAAIAAEFETPTKSVKEEDCEKVGQFGPDGGSCGKKEMGAEGFDANEFKYGSSQGGGVTDPAGGGE